MEMRRAGMVLVAAAALVVLLAFAAFAQTATAGASVDQGTASATTTTGTTTTAPSAGPPGTVPAGTAATSVTTTAVAGQPIMTTGSACGASATPPILNYASLWNAGGARERVSGRIMSVDQYYPSGPGSAPGIEVMVGMTTEDSESTPDWRLEEQPAYRIVQLGPAWFVQQHFGRLRVGQDITAFGVPAEYNGRRVLLAHAASINGRRVMVANRMNCPMWAGGWQNWGQTAVASAAIGGVGMTGAYNPDTVHTVSGKIEHVWTAEPVPGMGQNQMISIRQPDNTSLTVALAPSSFVSQSGVPLTIGDQVTATGSMVTVDGQPLLLASQLQEGDRQLTLRDGNGNPAWTVAAAAAPVTSAEVTGAEGSTSASASASVGPSGAVTSEPQASAEVGSE